MQFDLRNISCSSTNGGFDEMKNGISNLQRLYRYLYLLKDRDFVDLIQEEFGWNKTDQKRSLSLRAKGGMKMKN